MYDPKGAVKSLMSRGNAPPFSLNLWQDVLCNRFLDFAAIIDDHRGIIPQHHDSLELEDGEKLTIRHKPLARGKKLHSQSDWWMAFNKYKRALLWAYPHREAELAKYSYHLESKFSSSAQHARIVSYESAIRRFVHERDDLTLADIHEFSDISFSHLHTDGAEYAAFGKSTDRPKPSSNSKPRNTPICGEYNSKKGCSRDLCRFRHVCRACRGNHARHQCPSSESQ